MNRVLFFSFVAVIIVAVSAQYHGLDDKYQHLEEFIDYRAKPYYRYDYGVNDPHTHDIKSHWEKRDDKETKGVYTILQPDGRKRIVEYIADKNGVNYKVRYEGGSKYGGLGALSNAHGY